QDTERSRIACIHQVDVVDPQDSRTAVHAGQRRRRVRLVEADAVFAWRFCTGSASTAGWNSDQRRAVADVRPCGGEILPVVRRVPEVEVILELAGGRDRA